MRAQGPNALCMDHYDLSTINLFRPMKGSISLVYIATGGSKQYDFHQIGQPMIWTLHQKQLNLWKGPWVLLGFELGTPTTNPDVRKLTLKTAWLWSHSDLYGHSYTPKCYWRDNIGKCNFGAMVKSHRHSSFGTRTRRDFPMIPFPPPKKNDPFPKPESLYFWFVSCTVKMLSSLSFPEDLTKSSH